MELSNSDPNYIAIVDVKGEIDAQTLRQWFESSVEQTESLRKAHPDMSCIRDENGAFLKYSDDKTQAAWVGFAIGARAFQRYVKALARSHSIWLN